MSQFPVSQPGFGPGSLTLTPRMLFIMDTLAGDFLPQGRCIDGYNTRDPDNGAVNVAELRPGLVLGKVSSASTGGNATAPIVGQYASSIVGTLNNAITNASTQTSIVTSNYAGTELVRRVGTSGTLVLTGPPTTLGVVATYSGAYSAVAIGTTTSTVTLTAPLTAFIAGTWIGVLDGSHIPTTVLCGDLFPVRVTDINGNSMANVPLRLIPITNKPFKTANIINYNSANSLGAYLKTKLRVVVPGFTFDDDF